MTQTLRSDYWQLFLQPERGVQWAAAQVRAKDNWVDVVPDCRDGKSTLSEANFHMLPYSNRIRDGRFCFEGRDIQLKDAARHAIHGALRKLPFRVTEQSDTALRCVFDSSDEPPINWPWPLQASIDHELNGRVLSSFIALTNLGQSNMPCGTGWHPYFVHKIQGSTVKLCMNVTGIYPDEAGDCLPDGPPVAIPHTHDYTRLRTLDPDQRIDCCLTGLTGPVQMQWPEAGIELMMTASENCSHLVFFNPDAPHFAVEPVTNANDAFNLQSRGIAAGVQVLAPNETLRADMTIELREII